MAVFNKRFSRSRIAFQKELDQLRLTLSNRDESTEPTVDLLAENSKLKVDRENARKVFEDFFLRQNYSIYVLSCAEVIMSFEGESASANRFANAHCWNKEQMIIDS